METQIVTMEEGTYDDILECSIFSDNTPTSSKEITSSLERKSKRKGRKQSTSTKRKSAEIEEGKSKKRKSNEEEECDFILEKGVFTFEPSFPEWNQVPKPVLDTYKVVWEMFATCARCTIHEQLEMKNTSRVHHMVIGNCLPTVFYLVLKESKGKFYQWYQNVMQHGIKVKQDCIQFRFKDCLPPLDNFDDWADFKLNITNDTFKYGKKEMVHHLKIKYISLTCNVSSFQVYTSFKFEKEIILQ
ncbi:hypothetical protein NAEGRDRAFT_62544 [Naegleria gruberi]|uniref:Uncharacterized protein n=1 Tax=Naegleria gruberi TaxID=5762 RepID=D2V1D8_NAEGR|nr:uncharacterized protein NAEGRDRAFT_62544 [Naegleria gruberi]EFC49146.1 hypothetical protein NAEGRDRAFT_62544 [Naegleria gruberi]|eukprot:XP_002681890.1 hypothetical protein NAEGRDRAFT_62544 [Naegleria gruberi strain NEG-M]